MVKCINAQCKNYEKELEEKAESCPLCGIKTEKTAANINSNLSIASILAAIVSVVTFWTSWGGATMAVGVILSVASIVLGFISKKKPSIVISIISLLVIVIPTIIMWME